MAENTGNRYGKLVKILQVFSFLFMAAMLTVCIVFMAKNHISVKTADQLTLYLSGGVFTVALILIGFSIVKSFALIFPPAILFVLSGMVFDSFLLAVFVNFIATALSLILPYYLGRFTGRQMIEALTGRFKAVKKIDDFADANSFALVFIFKAGGLMPSDLSSLIFGAMNIPFGKYFIASNLGMLILNVLWTLLGSKGDLSNPFSYLYALPALVFAVVASVVMNKIKKKKQIQDNKEETETDEEV
ncbi:MAG: VTT domain-containing protein [Clostridia bacterium]|nr:VTT domain-containing protein [Clostridia bacterium]